MNMKAMFEAAQAAGDFVTLTIDRDWLRCWERNPLHFLARVIGLTIEEAAAIADVAPEHLTDDPPAGLKLREFEQATARLTGAMFAGLQRPGLPVRELSFALLDAWCEAENIRLERREAAKEARAAERKAAKIAAKVAALQTEAVAILGGAR